MHPRRPESELTALLIAPNRDLAEAFLATVPRVRGFQVLVDLQTFPAPQTLEMRLRQLAPEVILIDLASSPEQAAELIRTVESHRPAVNVVALHTHNDSEAILHALRNGASEFLYAPFDPAIQLEAVSRLRKLRQTDGSSEQEQGRLVMFSSAKPGSGASTLATQTAFMLRRTTGKRVLLADFDLAGGTLGLYLKLPQHHSLLDFLRDGPGDASRWTDYTVSCGGVDILLAPETPHTEALDPSRVQEVLQAMRFFYDWVVIDLPSVFNRLSLLALAEAEKSYLISTTELPSLHLTRKAIGLLAQLGFGKDRFHVVVNRVGKKDEIAGNQIEKLFDCPIHAALPNDYFSLHRVITLGRPLGTDCALGKSIETLTSKIAAGSTVDKKRPGGVTGTKPALSQT